ncbi:PPOX class F420-dependent oxidoreductase [Streptomyces sp. NBRC 109706]|uniref:PPOX class F420-dependent oxidoreductase n=1 Tax=Streptomyces sp. NBRC 109706 TaxID=1550035 RepID=UPI0007865DA6|nr:PPOX class F420-dependent oxidoreductase [Streptomyces sp. NBRC 109706]
MSIPEDVAAARYVNLTTFRRTGVPVATPVWLAPDGERMVLWTNNDSGKVKRLRHTADVTVTVCDIRGRVRPGTPEHRATARVLDAEESRAARAVLSRRYRMMRLGSLLARVVPRITRRGIAVAVHFDTPDSPETGDAG